MQDGYWQHGGEEVEDEKEIMRLDDLHDQQFEGRSKELDDSVDGIVWAPSWELFKQETHDLHVTYSEKGSQTTPTLVALYTNAYMTQVRLNVFLSKIANQTNGTVCGPRVCT